MKGVATFANASNRERVPGRAKLPVVTHTHKKRYYR
jgi:hypothetical protein